MNLEEALKEIERLKKANEKLESDNLSLKSELSKEQKEKLEYKLKYEEMILKLQNAIEKERIKKHRLFGVKSEKEKQILNEAEKEANKESNVISKRGRKPGVSSLEKFLDSLVSFKTVNVTKEEYKKLLEQEGYIKIGENKCHKLEYVPGHFELVEYVYDQIKDVNNDMILPSDRDVLTLF